MKKNICVFCIGVLLAFSTGLAMDIGFKNGNDVFGDNTELSDTDLIDNKGSGWGLKKVKNAECEVTQKQKDDLKKYNSFYIDEKRGNKIYLTFDEGYENGYTSQILDVLKEKNVKAAFFITGPYANKETELVSRMIKEGHTVGNHTVNHPNLHKLEKSDKICEEIEKLNKMVYNEYGYKMKYVRPPEGEYSERVLACIEKLDMRGVFWSFAYKDWDANNQKGKEYAFNNVTPYIHNGAVLLLHAVSKDNAEALGDIIDWAKDNGYEFATLDEVV